MGKVIWTPEMRAAARERSLAALGLPSGPVRVKTKKRKGNGVVWTDERRAAARERGLAIAAAEQAKLDAVQPEVAELRDLRKRYAAASRANQRRFLFELVDKALNPEKKANG